MLSATLIPHKEACSNCAGGLTKVHVSSANRRQTSLLDGRCQSVRGSVGPRQLRSQSESGVELLRFGDMHV
jgi:hypothetical protein